MSGWHQKGGGYDEKERKAELEFIESSCFDSCESDWLRVALHKRGVVRNSDAMRERSDEMKATARQNETQAEAIDREYVSFNVSFLCVFR